MTTGTDIVITHPNSTQLAVPVPPDPMPSAMTIGAMLAEQAGRRPGALAVAMSDWSATYAELDALATSLASRIHRLGVVPGERVAILFPNRREWFELFFGLARLGAVQVPLNPYLKGEFLRHQLVDAGPAVVIVDEAGRRAVEALLPDLPSVRAVVTLDDRPDDASPMVRHVSELPDDPAFVAPDVLPEDLAGILYTSGTTGLAKGCMLSHGYYHRCGVVDQWVTQLGPEDVFFCAMPLFHGGAQLKVLMPCLLAGAPAIYEPAFSPTSFMRRATEVGATIINGVGAMATMLLSAPASEWDRAHRLRVCNIAPLSEDNQLAFRERYGTDVWAESYGLTECVPVFGTPPAGPRDRGGSGLPVFDLQVRLLDDGAEVADGEVGEICLRPRHRFAMFDGYWNRPEDTLEAFAGLWFHTGDFGRRRPSGAIAFVDRKKDAMRRRGENVSSIEVETAIGKHPAVLEVAVHAVRSDHEEDEIKACLVPAPGASIEPGELFAWLHGALPYFAMPRYVELLDEIPKNHLGRVLKHTLRSRGVTDRTWDFEALGLSVGRDERR
ncbi:AMP-binding protein [Streptomyces sp. GQFP]|uniref:AMP-binding protein n=1 Tax=Streptomyces sp. GQFP TaxID=2907545 RepID=UPI001F2904F2|nr:AMP-binding protein [Streptomyces sp. GQFP]UIX31967.1 AMP-binding protein [Streptomyces sp. GQFP]